MSQSASNTNAGYNYGTISQVSNNVTNNVDVQVNALDAAVKDLYAHTAPGAMHNAGDRVDAPRCHEETREAVQEDILSGLTHGDSGEPRGLVWLTGPAGGGKTAIVGTVCDRLRARRRLAAAFYFSSHKGSPDRKSKRFVVTTLAYQLRVHPALSQHISTSMLSTIQNDPAILQMDLKTQMEELVLKPFRKVRHLSHAIARESLVVAVDGVDECGEDQYGDSNRSRETDQVEVLSVLLQATRDPAFPCLILVASRPEVWIRRFLDKAAHGLVTEIFLDDKYNPDQDIELFLKSKFSELSRRCGYDSSVWPKQSDIDKLVADASGQFIYAATIIRFIDSPGAFPKDQLDIVLKIRPLAGPSPFRILDALYIGILKLSPMPAEAALWLKAIDRIAEYGFRPKASAWTVDRLFESHEGQALRVIRTLPSLLYVRSFGVGYCDFVHYTRSTGRDSRLIGPVDFNSLYSFYHKSFIDFLRDPARSGDAFTDSDAEVGQWIWGRIVKVFERAYLLLPRTKQLTKDMCVQSMGLKSQWMQLFSKLSDAAFCRLPVSVSFIAQEGAWRYPRTSWPVAIQCPG